MSSSIVLQGFGLGLSMIIPIGAQNAFVLNQAFGVIIISPRQRFVLFAMWRLIFLGVFGGGALLASNEMLLSVVTVGG